MAVPRKVFVFIEPVSFHKQIDGLKAVVSQKMVLDPLSGHYFVFRSCSRHSARILSFDGTGFSLLTKRLSSGVFKNWPTSRHKMSRLLARELMELLWPDT